MDESKIVKAIVENMNDLRAPEAGRRNGIDINGFVMPDGWAVYYDGELVFSVDEDKWREIGPGIEQIMEG